jgi:plasmid stabilization system protein ParE
MAEVKFTHQSIADLEDIAENISKDSVFYASMQVQKLPGRTDRLARFPFIGRMVPELKTDPSENYLKGSTGEGLLLCTLPAHGKPHADGIT